MMKVAYFPGCSLHSTAKEYDMSCQLVSRRLGIELQEISQWICCGATSAHVASHLLSVALPCKNLTLAEEMGLDTVIAPCAACFNRLKVAHQEVREDLQLKKEVEEVLDKPYGGKVTIKHLLEVIVKDIGLEKMRKVARRKLQGLKIASYYGCLLVRPPKVVSFDDSEDPQSMDNLVAALGGEALPWAFKTECCGASFSLSETDIALELSGQILNEALEAGAECIVVACPLCQSNLDLRQKGIEKRYGKEFNLPILYFSELLGLALGMNPRELGLFKHMVNCTKLLKKLVLES
jgi:heterodisulfide reductase subunit B